MLVGKGTRFNLRDIKRVMLGEAFVVYTFNGSASLDIYKM